MKDRPYLRTLLTWGFTALAIWLGAKYGIDIPPPPLPLNPPPVPPPVPPDEPKSDVVKAIGRIQFGNAGCSATPIGHRTATGKYRIVSAAHCITHVGQRGQFRAQSGDTLGCEVVSLNKSADCAWIVTDTTTLTLPFAELADTVPPSGSAVWHAGYGIDKPGNRENGTFVSGPDSNGQVKFRLSVSSGDSGGAIVLADTGRVLSVVCCTSGMARVADVWGAGPDALLATRREAVDDWVWTPTDIRIRVPKD